MHWPCAVSSGCFAGVGSRLAIVSLLLLGFLFGLIGNFQSCVVGSRSPTKTNFLL